MSEYPENPCKNGDLHLGHTHADYGVLENCPGVGDNQEYVYRLVDKDTGQHLQAYGGQFVYTDRSQARAQRTKFNNKSWRSGEAVIQRGLIQWTEDPV